MPFTTAEQLMHTTVRLECADKKEKLVTGTGFFFSFSISKERAIPVIITNKHVVRDKVKGTIVLTHCDDNNEPIIGSHEKVSLSGFENRCMGHPDEKVDLAAILIYDIVKTGKFFVRTLAENLIPSTDEIKNLTGLENIIMIGYPNGIWDNKNNMPIVRSGITATNPKYDHDGLPEFLIDCACYPGSSGSPVFIFDNGASYTDARGNLIVGNSRVYLLGVLYGGPLHKGKVINKPLQRSPISLAEIPNNLGYVIKAEKINDLKNHAKFINKQ